MTQKTPPDKTKASEPVQPADPEPAMRRVVIRSGDIEFEVDSFDAARRHHHQARRPDQGRVRRHRQQRQAPQRQGQGLGHRPHAARGARRARPRAAQGLGKAGELKGQKIGSQDVTKQYTDLESRLAAARTMEKRLLQIIKEGKGEIKDLLAAEKELGVWRTKIEEFEGELRYYANLAALSTLTITLTEKEIRAAAGSPRASACRPASRSRTSTRPIRQLLAAVIEAKGRVTKSELKQLAAGQFNASLQFEVAPDSAGPLRDRLRQLGRSPAWRSTACRRPRATVAEDAKVKRGDTRLPV